MSSTTKRSPAVLDVHGNLVAAAHRVRGRWLAYWSVSATVAGAGVPITAASAEQALRHAEQWATGRGLGPTSRTTVEGI